MECICVEPELTCFQVRHAGECLGRLSRLALSAGLVRAGVMFAQVRLQLFKKRIGLGIPLNDCGWMCLANLFTETVVRIGGKTWRSW